MRIRAWIVVAAGIAAASPAYAVTATWTGRQEMVTTVSGLSAWNCQYQYAGQYFWRVFQTSCPASIEVQ